MDEDVWQSYEDEYNRENVERLSKLIGKKIIGKKIDRDSIPMIILNDYQEFKVMPMYQDEWEVIEGRTIVKAGLYDYNLVIKLDNDIELIPHPHECGVN